MGTKIKIMIIDDSYTNRILFKAILEEMDIEVTEVHSAEKALTLLDEVNPHIILLDMCMPTMTGIDFLIEIQRLDITTPIIVISVLDELSYVQQAFLHGASDYLVKPVDVDELIKRIAQYTENEVLI
jgi:CheY-like chemotaxis protein